jgi:hypothetical protein
VAEAATSGTKAIQSDPWYIKSYQPFPQLFCPSAEGFLFVVLSNETTFHLSLEAGLLA